MNIEIPPFYIGQEVVANCNHPDGAFRKGDEFVVTRLLTCCGIHAIEIGMPHDLSRFNDKCRVCGLVSVGWHFYASRFSPKIQIGAFVSMKEVVSLETVGAN